MVLPERAAPVCLLLATARSRRATRYETAHVLQALLRTGDPVTRTAAARHPQLTADAVRRLLGRVTGAGWRR